MNQLTTGILDGVIMQYTYQEMGTVRVTYDRGCIGFVWTDGPIKGEAGEGFVYRAREVGADQYFVNWHEPEMPGFVTLYIDFPGGRVHSSVLGAYGTDDEQIHFDTATINQLERP